MVANQNGLAVAGATSLVLDDERMELLRRTIANEAPPLEFELFVADCNRRGLDPFAKQIYLIPRNVKTRDGKWETKWTAQTSIDGYRLIADRTGKYAGSDEPVYDREDAEHPNKASVTVWKLVGGQRVPFTSSVRWDEYCQTSKDGNPSGMWGRMPYVMLAKCAESAALRKAFPQELSGLYTREEMEQDDREQLAERVAARLPATASEPEPTEAPKDERTRANGEFFALVTERGLTDDERHAIQRIAYGVESATELDARQLRSLAKLLRENSAEDIRAKIAKQAELDAQTDADAANHDPASPIPDYLRKIRAATSEDALKAITQEMQTLGVWHADVTVAVADKRNELGLAAPKATTTKTQLIGVPIEGDAGDNRHTN